MNRQGCLKRSTYKWLIFTTLIVLGMVNLTLFVGFVYRISTDQEFHLRMEIPGTTSTQATASLLMPLEFKMHESGPKRKRLHPKYENNMLIGNEHKRNAYEYPDYDDVVGQPQPHVLGDSGTEVDFSPNGGLEPLKERRILPQRPQMPKPQSATTFVKDWTSKMGSHGEDQGLLEHRYKPEAELKELWKQMRVSLVSPSPPTATGDEWDTAEPLQPLSQPELTDDMSNLLTPKATHRGSDFNTATLEWDMHQCSVAMGIPEDHIRRSRADIRTVAREASTFLDAIWTLVPKNFSKGYKNPCWASNLPLTMRMRGFLLVKLNSEHRNFLSSTEILSLANKLFHQPSDKVETTLLCMPYFFTAGFPKCGTSSLHLALQAHLDIASPYTKEPHWWTRIGLGGFSSDYLKLTVVRYLLNFLDSGKTIMKNHNSITYDASQSTLWDSNFFINAQDYCVMPAIISRVLPKAKLIVLMRNPVSRVYSHFLYSCSYRYGDFVSQWPDKGVRTNPAKVFHTQSVSSIKAFNNCLQTQNGSLYECVNHYRFKESTCGNVGFKITVSLYYIHLLKWLQFYPKGQFLFLRTEDLTSKPHMVMQKITNFLEIAPVSSDQATQWLSRKVNVQRLVTTGTEEAKMREDTRIMLEEFYRPYNVKLAELTGDKAFLWED